MPILDNLRWRLADLIAPKAPAPNRTSPLVGVLQTSKPPTRGTAELMAAYSQLPWLRAVVHRIASSIAATDWQLYVGQGDKRRDIDSHPLLDLLDNANPFMTGQTARKLTQIYLDLKGECFWVLERNGASRPTEYYPVPPHWVQETPTAERPVYRVRLGNWNGEIPATDVIWLRDPDPANPYGRGTGIAEALGDELETDEYTAKHVKTWFYNRATPELLIGVEGANEEELKRVKQRWEDEHRGFQRAYRTHWHPGKLDVVQLSQSFQNQQLVELRRFERDTIIQVFGVPPEILGVIENSNRATIESADYLFAKWVLVPRLEFLRAEMQEKLVPLFDPKLELDYVSPVPEDKEYQLRVAQAAPWALTRNEWREMLGQEPDETDGDVYLVPVGLVPEGRNQPPELSNVEAAKQGKAIRKALREDEVPNILEALRPEHLQRELDPEFQALVENWGTQALRDLGIDISFDLLNPKVVEFLQDFSATRIKDLINETTRQQLRDELVEGVRLGESIPQLANRIGRVFEDAKGRRAKAIARTEVLRGSNFGTYQAHVISGVVAERQWVATPDGRTRDEHRALNGQVRAINQPFTAPNGETAMYPGDFGVPSLDIQCRCTTIPVIEKPKDVSELEAVWKVYDRALIPWERRLEAAAKRGFQKQHNEALRILNELAGREQNAA